MTEKETPIPFYLQVAETLRRRILTDEYPEGGFIPSALELEKEFGVSNITIRKALEILSQDGVLARKRGVGTVVAKFDRDLVTFEVTGSFERMVRSVDQLPLEMEVLDMAVIACPHHVGQLMKVEPGSPVWRMKRVRKHKGSPLSFYLTYSDPGLCRGITKKAVEKENLIPLFERTNKLKLVRLEQKLEAVIADIDLSAMLKVRFGAPLFFVENLYSNPERKPTILSQIYFRGDRCSYTATAELAVNKEG
jgi:GntR family transcriptional regulator